jgi:hypothetical protein
MPFRPLNNIDEFAHKLSGNLSCYSVAVCAGSTPQPSNVSA